MRFAARFGLLRPFFGLLGVLVLSNMFSLFGPIASGPATVSASGATIHPLPYRVLDAEYSRALDRIITVSESPNQLSIYNPVDQTTVQVALPRIPRNVSVGPDGLFAAVGHEALVSYVDLQQGVLVKTLDVTVDPADVVLAGNGMVYISPVRDQWVKLYAIDIATNVEQLSTGNSIRAGTLYKLHPNGQSLYGANRGLSPGDIEKINISVQPPARLYDSPYHGDYKMGGDLWLSEDGLRIFTACGNVFRASDTQSQDMTYNGSFAGQGINSVGHLSHSQAANMLVVIPQRRDYSGGCYGTATLPDTQVVLLNYEHFGLERTVSLPQFQVGSNSYPSHGRFVFVNNAGTDFYTIVQADSSSALLNDYGVVRASIAPPPPPSPTATATETATPSPTATATGTATPSPTATATGTATPSPTATATGTATPTSTSQPIDGVWFESNFSAGAPGSIFIFTASGLPANAEVTISLRCPGDANYRDILTTTTGNGGQFIFVLATTAGDPPGTYAVRLTLKTTRPSRMANIILEETIDLKPGAPQHNQRPAEPVPEVPAIDERKIYLPSIIR